MAFSSPSNMESSKSWEALWASPVKSELRAGMELVLDEAAEESRRGGAIEAMVVVKHSDAHESAW